MNKDNIYIFIPLFILIFIIGLVVQNINEFITISIFVTGIYIAAFLLAISN